MIKKLVPQINLMFLIIICVSCKWDLPEIFPSSSLVANFTLGQQGPNFCAPITIKFANSSVNADEFIWDFGDPTSGLNNTSTETDPSHTYNSAGRYCVELIARNSMTNKKDSFAMEILVRDTIERTYNFGNTLNKTDEGWGIVQIPDGGYIIAGRTFIDNDCQGLIVKMNENGTLDNTFTKVLGGPEVDFFRSVVQLKGGGIAATGRKNGDLWVVTVDANGTLNEKSLDFGERDTGYEIIQTSNGDLVVVGSKFILSGNSDTKLVFFDTNLNQKDVKTYDTGYSDEGTSLIQTNSGGFAIVGRTMNANGDWDIQLILTDSDGNRINNRLIRFDGGQTHDGSTSIIQKQDGGFAITGHAAFDGYLIITDEYGTNPITKRILSLDITGFPGGDLRAKDILENSDGDLIICGPIENQSKENSFLIKTDRNGNLYPQLKRLFEPDNLESMIQTMDGRIVITGYCDTNHTTGRDLLLIKTCTL